MKKKISSVSEFMNAIHQRIPLTLEIQTSLVFPYSVVLPPGVIVHGIDPQISILSFNSGDGLGLSGDNEISNLSIQTNPSYRAIYVASEHTDLGILKLNNLTVTGQVQILTRSSTKKAKLIAEQIDIVSCDSRKYPEQPQKYGVNVYQGAFTVYNFSSDPESLIQASLTNISLGRKSAPVIGSGLYVSGFGDKGGRVEVDMITTGNIYSNGMLPYGIPDMITAGVFIVYGVHVKNIVHHGTVTTYGVNDMVLDTWGRVDEWIAEKPITSYGPSGIGFVNFGVVDRFEAKDKIETFGLGARGFNQYDGTIKTAIFDSITTHGDGSIGIQVSKPVGTIEVKGPVLTHGSVGQTLVKGVIMTLPANGVSVKAGGEIQNLILGGGIITEGNHVHSLDVEGKIAELSVKQDIQANGAESVGAFVAEGGQSPLDHLSVLSKHGVAVHLSRASKVQSRAGLIAKGALGDVVRE